MRYSLIQANGGATPLMYACQQCNLNDVLDILMKQPHAIKERDRTLKTPLHYCAENANTSCAEALLKIAPELVNAQDDNGYCPLHMAVIAGNVPLIKVLVARGADVNLPDNEGHSPVHWAIVSSEKEALSAILRSKANPSTPDIHGGYPIHYAVQMCGANNESSKAVHEAVRVVEELLRHGVNVNVTDKDGRQPILWAASAGSTQIMQDLIDSGARVDSADKDGLTALHCAASRGHTETVYILVTSCGAEVDVIDANGCSALFYAVTLGRADATAMLLKLGAQPNRQDRKGRTPAHCGAAKGQLETLKILEKHGGNLWIRNVKGDFPFHDAVASGRRDLVLWFLEKNPDAINIGNNDGRCPLHLAAMYNNPDMIKMLLECKCMVNPVMRSSKGVLMTPLNVALSKGHRGCGKLLQLHGGVPFSKISKSDAYFINSIGVSPNTDKRSNRDQEIRAEEMISPSFTVINTSLNYEDDDMTMKNEKRKVYRRRKKRKSHSNGKSFESDSEDSVREERAKNHTRYIPVTIKNGNIENGGIRRETRDGETSSVIRTDDSNLIQKIGKELSEDNTTKREASGKFLQKKSSIANLKKMSTLSPDNFPRTMQTISNLDSEITEGDLDEAKTPNENENVEKESSVSISKIEIHQVSNEGDTKDGTKTSELLSPSFTVLRDRSETLSAEIDKIEQENVESEQSEQPVSTQKKTIIEKREKSKKIIQSKSSTVKKYEKTTKSVARKPQNEENVSGEERKSQENIKIQNNIVPEKKLEKENSPLKDSTAKENEGKESPSISAKDDARELLKAEAVSEEQQKGYEQTLQKLNEAEPIPLDSMNFISTSEPKPSDQDIKSESAVTAPIKASEPKLSDQDIKPETAVTAPIKTSDINGTINKEQTDAFPKKEVVEITEILQPESAGSTANVISELPLGTPVQEEIVIAEIHKPAVLPDNLSREENRTDIFSPASAPNDETTTSFSLPVSTPKPTEREESTRSLLQNDAITNVKIEKTKLAEDSLKLEEYNVTEGSKKSPEEISSSEAATVGRTDNIIEPVLDDSHIHEQGNKRLSKSSHLLPEIGKKDDDLNTDFVAETITSIRLPKIDSTTVASKDEDVALIDDYKGSTSIHETEEKKSTKGDSSKPEPKPRKLNENKIKAAKRDSINYIVTEEGESEKGNKSGETGGESEKQATTSTKRLNEAVGEEEPSTSRIDKPGPEGLKYEQRIEKIPRVSRLCRRNKDFRGTSHISVNQLVQGTIRKYHLERGIFHQLLELKRMQIRAGRANEQILVKRLSDEYERFCACQGLTHYLGPYKFKDFEKFLYEQLKSLNRGHLVIPEMKSYDDIDALSGILKKSRFKILTESPVYEPQCSCLTQRCHHSTRAYTTLPCSAYVASIRRNKIRKSKKESFLPQICPYKMENERRENLPTTLELIQGNKKQVIELPPTHPAKSKKYYITFTIRSSHAFKHNESDEENDFYKYRHAKSV